MSYLWTCYLCLLYFITPRYCQRRIVNGTESVGAPRYLAYFVKTDQSKVEYTGWVCGGCIVHPVYILTSAACLKDVNHVYAIAGYKKYISSEEIDKDRCTARIKKRVVARIYQKEYNPKQPKPKPWNSRDISLAKVETPFDFRDPIYVQYCSYPPNMIRVNYISNFQDSGIQAVVFGWGHKKYFRLVNDKTDYNEKIVHYASTVVIDKEFCKNKLKGHKEIQQQIDPYLICTLGPGTLNEKGKLVESTNFFNNSDCENFNSSDVGNSRRDNRNKTHDFYTYSYHDNFRRNGPCQNDHGGPLVTWIGGQEYVIGVACGFQVNKDMECVGPFLYTSTYSNAEFLYCMLRFTRGLNFCNKKPADKGFDIIEDRVQWNMTLENNKTINTERHINGGTQSEELMAQIQEEYRIMEDKEMEPEQVERTTVKPPEKPGIRKGHFTTNRRVFLNLDYDIFYN